MPDHPIPNESDPSSWPACQHCGGGQPVHHPDCPAVTGDRRARYEAARGRYDDTARAVVAAAFSWAGRMGHRDDLDEYERRLLDAVNANQAAAEALQPIGKTGLIPAALDAAVPALDGES